MRARLARAFDRFVDVRALSDERVARLLREMEIDIAVDLKGHTTEARFRILAHRPAPVQVAYLGYPGTCGAGFIDYVLADRFVLPEAERQHWTEKVVYLPDCYQVNDATRAISPAVPGRAAAGLPEAGFVFCCFNNSYKIGPEVFQTWLRILRDVPDSVLPAGDSDGIPNAQDLCPRFGIACTLVDGRDLEQWTAAFRPNTKAVFFETPSNPTLELVDIAAVSEIAHRHGATVIVDNVFATPMLQRPLALGADVVVYSATKHIDGQGRCLGGVVLGPKEFIEEKLHNYLKHTGPSLSPFNAWVLLKGLETLPLRVERHGASAAAIADFLSERKEVVRVFYPGRDDHPQRDLAKKQMAGGGPMVAFEVKGGKREAFNVLNALELIKISNNLGDAKSLATHPATTTHQRLTPEARAELGIFDNSIRLSIGLEDVEDLKADLDTALAAAR